MKAHIDGLDIYYEVSGTGPWITLSHSLAAHSGMWDAQLDLLNQHFTVLRYDLRGHGQTQATEGPYNLEQLADDIQGLLTHLGVSRTHWIGLSLGGMIGQMFAIRHPDMMGHAVIANSTGQGAPNATTLWGERAALAREQGMQALVEPTLSRWFTDPYRTKHPDVMTHVGQMIATTPVEGYAGCCAAISVINTLDRLQHLRTPGLIMVGDKDTATPPAMSEKIHQNWPHSTYVLLRDAAHLSSLEQAQAFNDAVMEFIPH